MQNLIFMADAASQNQSMGSLLLTTVVPLILIVVVFYFFLIRPQKKRDGEAKAMRENIQIGDEILTIGGIVGIVVKKTEDTVVIETGGNKSKLRIKIAAIQKLQRLQNMPNAWK